jgi:hypothetical protein
MQCGGGAAQVTSLGGSTSARSIQVNATSLFWMDTEGGGAIYSVPLAGGTASPIVPNGVTISSPSCSGHGLFAVDDGYVYYWSNGSGSFSGPTPNPSGLVRTSLSDGTTISLVPDSSNAPAGCPALAVDSSNVYWLSGQNGPAIWEVPLGGGTSTMVGTLGGSDGSNGTTGGLVVVAGNAVVWVANGGPQGVEALPLAGGSAMMLASTQSAGFGPGYVQAFTADSTSAYVVASWCPCADQGGSEPTGIVVKLPLDGGAATSIATVSGAAQDIATDGVNVYWATDSSVMSAPVGGGAVATIAGNLATGPYTCGGGCSSTSSPTLSIAVGSSEVYFTASSGAVYGAPK